MVRGIQRVGRAERLVEILHASLYPAAIFWIIWIIPRGDANKGRFQGRTLRFYPLDGPLESRPPGLRHPSQPRRLGRAGIPGAHPRASKARQPAAVVAQVAAAIARGRHRLAARRLYSAQVHEEQVLEVEPGPGILAAGVRTEPAGGPAEPVGGETKRCQPVGQPQSGGP